MEREGHYAELSRDIDGSIPELRVLRSGPCVEVIVSATAKWYGTEARHVLQPGGQTEARDAAAYLVRDRTGARLRELAPRSRAYRKPA